MAEEKKEINSKKLEVKSQWVKLYLVPQTETSDMPPFVVGLLTGETTGGYVLNPMLELTEGGETAQVGMNVISKTYVWRCQILDSEPDADGNIEEASEGLGGLGED